MKNGYLLFIVLLTLGWSINNYSTMILSLRWYPAVCSIAINLVFTS